MEYLSIDIPYHLKKWSATCCRSFLCGHSPFRKNGCTTLKTNNLGWPPNSQHQHYCCFGRGFQPKPAIATITGKGDNPKHDPSEGHLKHDFPFQFWDICLPEAWLKLLILLPFIQSWVMIKPPGYFVCIYLEYIYIYIHHMRYTHRFLRNRSGYTIQIIYDIITATKPPGFRRTCSVHVTETTSIDDLKLGWWLIMVYPHV